VPNAKDVTLESEWRRFLLVGAPGSGKSIFASTAPTKGYVFDFACGIDSYRGKDFDYGQWPVTPQGWLQFEKDFQDVKKRAHAGEFQTCVADDCTAFATLAMERSLMLDPSRSPAGGPLWNKHYQAVRFMVEGKIRQMLDFPCNVIVIAHVDVIQDQESGEIVAIEPLLPGKLSKILPGLFGEVYYATNERKEGQTRFLMQTVAIGMKQARSRISGEARYLPDFIANNYADFTKHLNAAKAKQTKTKEK